MDSTSTSSRVNRPPTPVISDGSPLHWSLILDDEFNQSHLGLQRWTTCYWWDNNGCTNAGNHELEWYQPGNVSVSNGALKLTAEQQPVIGSDGNPYPYTSGMVTTGRDTSQVSTPVKFQFTYGFTEIRAKIPTGRGLWPAFWLLPANNSPIPEIDVVEVTGDSPDVAHMSVHYSDQNGQAIRVGNTWDKTQLSSGWHTYAIDWEPDHIAWYIDGYQRWRIDQANLIPSVPMYLLLDLAVGGDWPGFPDGNTAFPNTFEIDYVRVWQRASK